MSSYRRLLLHLIIRTKYRQRTINQENDKKLYAYIAGVVKNKNSFLYRINGVEDHIHILCDIHCSISVADFVKDLKVSSSIWARKSGFFPRFRGWSVGYGAFSCNYYDKDHLINYIKNQKQHHARESFESEFQSILDEYGLILDERFFID